MEEKKEQIEKIVVKSQDELIDVVRKISNTDAKKIVVSFVEDSDILISSINLKVLLDSADEKESLLILQIPANPSGIRNAKLADIPVVDSPSLPSDEVWKEAQDMYTDRLKKSSKSSKAELPQDYKSENITSFEDRVNSVLDKSKEERGRKEVEEKKDSGIVVDQDIQEDRKEEVIPREDLTTVDFKSVHPQKKKRAFNITATFDAVMDFFKNIGSKKEKGSKRTPKERKVQGEKKNRKEVLVKLLPKLVIPVVGVLLLASFLYYRFAPFVRATIFIESKPVEVEKTFVGNENINKIDFENLEIPIKKETVTKSVSDTVDATGTAFRGEKATGSVTVSYISNDCPEDEGSITLNPGQKITTQDGSKSYVLKGSIIISCNKDFGVVEVEAIEVGEEYNISAGDLFSIEGYDSTKYATNQSAFTGGSKEEYTVLSQSDVNTKVEELTEIATDEAESSLQDIGNGWEIIESTVETEVKEGSIKSAVAIGTETNSSDVSLEVESSATYYYTQGVDEGLNDLLTEAAKNQNLFESDEGLDLTLTGEIEKELKVSDENGGVEILLTAASSVEPSVSKEALVEDLKGMKWEEGVEYINTLTFTSDKDPVINFEPDNFPNVLRHFPSRQGRIQLTVKKETVEE